jgi:HlyD family secretion protein
MSRWVKRIVVGLLIVAAGALIYYRFLRTQPVPVTVFQVERGTVEETVTNSKAGTVKARRRAKLSPEIGGRIAFIGARQGDRVKEGEVLLRINDADLRASLTLAEREVDSARATGREACYAADLAERELQRNLDLKDDRIVSVEILDRLESERDSAGARCEASGAIVATARAAVEVARATLMKAAVLAPFDGVVAELDGELGEWVSPSPPAVPIPPVYDIIDTTSIYVSAPLDEVDAGRVRTGLEARLTLDPYPGRSFSGRVSRVAPYVLDVEEQNRTLEVEVDFDDAEFARQLLPGTSADVEVILNKVESVLRIPSYALLEGSRVLVFDGGLLVERRVETGLRNWEFAELKEGLREGEPVVVSLDRAEIKEGATAVVRDGPAGSTP